MADFCSLPYGTVSMCEYSSTVVLCHTWYLHLGRSSFFCKLTDSWNSAISTIKCSSIIEYHSDPKYKDLFQLYVNILEVRIFRIRGFWSWCLAFALSSTNRNGAVRIYHRYTLHQLLCTYVLAEEKKEDNRYLLQRASASLLIVHI